jgi:hypothetical protein
LLKQWCAIEPEMNRSGDVASSGGGGYEDKKNEGGDLGIPYVFIDNSGFLLSGRDDKAFPARKKHRRQAGTIPLGW